MSYFVPGKAVTLDRSPARIVLGINYQTKLILQSFFKEIWSKLQLPWFGVENQLMGWKTIAGLKFDSK